MKHMPEFEQAIGFPSEEDNLKQHPLHIWKGLYFTSLSHVEKLPWSLVESRLDFLEIESFVHDASRDRDHHIMANWMLYVDNYLEGFHIPFVHPELNQALDYSGYTTELFEGGVLQIGKAASGDVKFDFPKGHPDYGQDIAAYYLWMFPNMMFNFYPWGLSINVVKPLSINKTKVSFLTYVFDDSKLHKGAGNDIDKVEREDEFIVENVNKGIQSSFYRSGRYSPTREQGVHHFHRLLAQFLN